MALSLEDDEEYKQIANECVKKAYLLLESCDWKIEKITTNGDVIKSTHKDRIGRKIYKLTGKLGYSARHMLKELFYNIEQVTAWNPTIKESKIIKKIDNHSDISYQVTATAGGGMIQARDFVNLRCWQLFQNGEIVETFDVNTELPEQNYQNEVQYNVLLQNESLKNTSNVNESRSLSQFDSEQFQDSIFSSLSKSLGAKNFVYDTEGFSDSVSDDKILNVPTLDESSTTERVSANKPKLDRVYITSAVSIDYAVPVQTSKYTRGQNIISAFAFREIENDNNQCIFEWLLCLDLKGFIPKKILEAAYTNFMQEYMTYLRKYITTLPSLDKNPSVSI